MTPYVLFLTFLCSTMTIGSNILLRMGVSKAGGVGVAGRGLVLDIVSLMGQPIFMTGVVLYGLNALAWFHLLSIAKLSTVYVMLVSLTFIGVTVLDSVVFGSSVSATKIAGIAIVITGIAVVALAES
jgi:multidrug transporter EmrE-like cation transporter